MSNASENLTDSELTKKALLLVHRLKNSGLDQESIYARLEKQGIPDEIAREAIRNIYLEIQHETVKDASVNYQFAVFRIGLGVVLAILSIIILPGYTIIPVGLILVGIISALIAKKKME